MLDARLFTGWTSFLLGPDLQRNLRILKVQLDITRKAMNSIPIIVFCLLGLEVFTK